MKAVKFEYKIEIPLMVTCSKDEDGHVSVDFVGFPDEDAMHKLIDKNAKGIKAMADVVTK